MLVRKNIGKGFHPKIPNVLKCIALANIYSNVVKDFTLSIFYTIQVRGVTIHNLGVLIYCHFSIMIQWYII